MGDGQQEFFCPNNFLLVWSVLECSVVFEQPYLPSWINMMVQFTIDKCKPKYFGHLSIGDRVGKKSKWRRKCLVAFYQTKFSYTERNMWIKLVTFGHKR